MDGRPTPPHEVINLVNPDDPDLEPTSPVVRGSRRAAKSSGPSSVMFTPAPTRESIPDSLRHEVRNPRSPVVVLRDVQELDQGDLPAFSWSAQQSAESSLGSGYVSELRGGAEGESSQKKRDPIAEPSGDFSYQVSL
mmetsp:Transcript_73541/g.215559  ORF Transcript_73541/g.215559 Transcript_73541/m.215559 type:complete len:137 (-) Transcript_73541:11-421(-)